MNSQDMGFCLFYHIQYCHFGAHLFWKKKREIISTWLQTCHVSFFSKSHWQVLFFPFYCKHMNPSIMFNLTVTQVILSNSQSCMVSLLLIWSYVYSVNTIIKDIVPVGMKFSKWSAPWMFCGFHVVVVLSLYYFLIRIFKLKFKVRRQIGEWKLSKGERWLPPSSAKNFL